MSDLTRGASFPGGLGPDLGLAGSNLLARNAAPIAGVLVLTWWLGVTLLIRAFRLRSIVR